MTEAANLLSDVGQRFTSVHLELLSLQTNYEVSGAVIRLIKSGKDDFTVSFTKEI